jgi:2-oxoglutarate ferredoxin oxidoreductase subunit beta
MVYIVENNGVYGLTKGQFSATSDRGSTSKRGVLNPDLAIDLAGLALQIGASFAARTFSGDKGQLVPLIKAAIVHRGAAFIDCLSPCIAFNNHDGSTKSFDYVREHNDAVNYLDVITGRETINAEYEPGEVKQVRQHDGSILNLRKLVADHDPHDRVKAMHYLQERQAAGEIVTGLLYVDSESEDLHANLNTVAEPLNGLTDAELGPGLAALEDFNAGHR